MFKKKIITLTFDLDWCTDEVLNHTLEKLIKDSVPATFFVTHHTKLLNVIRRHDFFELGIHPNFNNNSTHGENYQDIISHCFSLVPEALSSRSHGLLISSNIRNCLLEAGIKIDCSIFMPNNIILNNFFFEMNSKKIYFVSFRFLRSLIRDSM